MKKPSVTTLGICSTADTAKLQHIWWKNLTESPRWRHIPEFGCSKTKLLPARSTKCRAQLSTTAQRFCMTSPQQSSANPAVNSHTEFRSVSTKLPTSEATSFFWKQVVHSRFQAACSVRKTVFCDTKQSLFRSTVKKTNQINASDWHWKLIS